MLHCFIFIEYFYQIRVKMDERIDDSTKASDYFRKFLIDTTECIIIFESLEHERTLTECASDWVAGERNSINKARMTHDLKSLESSVKGVIKAYDKLFKALDRVKSLNKRSEQLSLLTSDIADPGLDDTSQLKTLKRLDSKFLENKKLPAEKLKCTAVKVGGSLAGGGGATALVAGVVGVATKVSVVKGCIVVPLVVKVATGTAGIVLSVGSGLVIVGGVAAIAGAVGAVAYIFLHSKDRGLRYQKLKRLYDAINDPQAIAQFQTLKEEIETNTQRINSQADDHKKSMDEALKIKKEDQAQALQVKRLQIETNLQVEKEKSAQKKENVFEAMELYRSSLKDELDELATAEPDWNEETRGRHAKKTAKKICVSFLKGRLNYTHDEADKFVEGLRTNLLS